MEKKEKKVGIFALGRLGVCFSLLCAENSYKVYGYDISKERCESIKNKTLKTTEPEVESLLSKNEINICNSVEEVFQNTDIAFVFVATPSLKSGEYSHQSINDIAKEIKQCGISNKTLCIVSTCMPFYPQALQDELSYLGINVLYMPSFISQGFICQNLRYADLVLLGGKNIPIEVKEVYETIMVKTPNFKEMSLTAAGITKISLNCYLTTKISFSNKIGEICINSGVEDEVDIVLNAIGDDSRIGNKFLKYGFGYSGVCLPRDNRALGIHAKKSGVSSKFQETIDTVNNEHLQYLYDYFTKLNINKEIPFTFYQLSYKKGVDILIDSQPLELSLLFLKNGYKVNIIESENVIEQAKPLFEKYKNNVTFDPNIKGVEIKLL